MDDLVDHRVVVRLVFHHVVVHEHHRVLARVRVCHLLCVDDLDVVRLVDHHVVVRVLVCHLRCANLRVWQHEDGHHLSHHVLVHEHRRVVAHVRDGHPLSGHDLVEHRRDVARGPVQERFFFQLNRHWCYVHLLDELHLLGVFSAGADQFVKALT